MPVAEFLIESSDLKGKHFLSDLHIIFSQQLFSIGKQINMEEIYTKYFEISKNPHREMIL